MPRNLDPAMAAALASGNYSPFFMALLSFKSQMQYIWTGVGSLVWNGNTFIGVGSLGSIGTITEDTNIEAYGTSVTLSGIDPVLLGECMSDMQPGAQATLWFGCLANGTIVGQPYQIFSGTMDQPSISVEGDSISITLALETKMLDLGRASNRRYSAADQRRRYPTDSSCDGVASLIDQAIPWGNPT